MKMEYNNKRIEATRSNENDVKRQGSRVPLPEAAAC